MVKEKISTGIADEFLDQHGHEKNNGQPIEIPAGFKRPETLAEQIQRCVRVQLSEAADADGMETFEESEDFDLEDDDPVSRYETFFDPVLGKDLSPAEFKQNEHLYRERYLQAQRNYFDHMDRQRAMSRESRGAGAPAPASTSPETAPKVEPSAT